MAKLDRLDRLYGLGAMPSSATLRPRRRSRARGPLVPSLVVTAVLLGGIVAVSPGDDALTIRRLFGIDDDRLATPPRVDVGVGKYAFALTQPGSDEPVAYDPCRAIEVEVNPKGAPDGYEELVTTGLTRVGEATGLQLTWEGVTDRLATSAATPARRPVLIAWATEEEVPGLAGDVAGLGGSAAVGQPGRMRYVTGSVVLDRDLFASFEPDERRFAQAIVDHELGHLVGLGHVDDPGELMHEDNLGRTTYGPGDLEGLARLGSVDC